MFITKRRAVAQTAGPFYTASAPLKRDLAADVADGQPITLAGHVLDTQCRPVPNAMVEIWHADRDGRYDTTGSLYAGISSPTTRAVGASIPSSRSTIRSVRPITTSVSQGRVAAF